MTNPTTGGHPDLKMVNPNAAAIDIGSTMHMASVNPKTCDMAVRAFGTFTQDLHDLAAWFRSCGVTSVAMESTGVYWITTEVSAGSYRLHPGDTSLGAGRAEVIGCRCYAQVKIDHLAGLRRNAA